MLKASISLCITGSILSVIPYIVVRGFETLYIVVWHGQKLHKITILFNNAQLTPPEGYTESDHEGAVTPFRTQRNKKAPYGDGDHPGHGREVDHAKGAFEKNLKNQKSVAVHLYCYKLLHLLLHQKTIDITIFFKVL